MSYHLTPLAAACQRWKNATRRSLFRHGGLLAASGLLRAAPEPAGIYESLGVRPIINCQGDKTILGGSLILPEVRSAMEAASRRFVDLDELMEGVGARLAALTGAEWGIVTSGCASAIANATAACIAGGDPEKLQRIPDLEGLKNEVIIPRFCRNVYDHAVRMVGVRIVEVETREELQQALSARTAMIYLYFPRVPLELEVVVAAARPKNVPVFVDAAAEDLSIPNRYLQRGATLVGYSGGKALHGPQCAGILLGRKDLVRAAFLHSAPHHAFGRPMKVGKEEILGMLAAVEAWTKRDHEAEHRQWEAWLDHIAGEVGQVAGVTARKQRPYTPAARIQLEIRWDSARLGITGEEVGRLLAQGEPRIIVGAATAASLIIAPPMMVAGEEKLVAGRIRALLAHPPRRPAKAPAAGPPAAIGGEWEAYLEFVSGDATHHLTFEQDGRELRGVHRGQFISGDLRGSVEGNEISFLSSQPIQSTWLRYRFTGTLSGDRVQGTVKLGEYGEARWTARRRRYAEPGNEPFIRPPKQA